MKREAIASDVLDELEFITDVRNNYKMSQRQTANLLLQAYRGTVWNPSEEIRRVIDLLDNKHVEIPKLPKKRTKIPTGIESR